MTDGVLLDMLNNEKSCVFFLLNIIYWKELCIIKRLISIYGLRFKTNVKLARSMSCDVLEN